MTTTEVQYADQVCSELSELFDIQREVPGTNCMDYRVRADAILTPKQASEWRDSHPSFVVEFKRPEWETFDTRNFTSWAAQAVSYTHVIWAHNGPLPVFTCPGVIAGLAPYGQQATDLMSRFLWQLGVGELQPTATGWRLVAAGRHILWSSEEGVREAARWSIRPRVGSSRR